MLSGTLDLLFPPRCGGCHERGAWLCATCREQIATSYGQEPHCSRCDRVARRSPCTECQRTPSVLMGQVIVGIYRVPLKTAIWSFKFEKHPQLARPLGALLAAAWRDRGYAPTDALIPVPMSVEHRRERGFNQAELLATECGRDLRLPVWDDALSRTRPAPPQRGLDAAARRANVVGLFAVERDVTGRTVVIVDDVTTTGATLEAIATTLLAAGAARVWGLALARPEALARTDNP